MSWFRVKEGQRFGRGGKYGPGDEIELTEEEFRGLEDKLEPILAETPPVKRRPKPAVDSLPGSELTVAENEIQKDVTDEESAKKDEVAKDEPENDAGDAEAEDEQSEAASVPDEGSEGSETEGDEEESSEDEEQDEEAEEGDSDESEEDAEIKKVVYSAAETAQLEEPSDFVFMSDDEILAVNGIGQSTLKKIRSVYPYEG